MQSSNELRDIISGWIDGSISSIHTALPGKIIDYDAGVCQAGAGQAGDEAGLMQGDGEFADVGLLAQVMPVSSRRSWIY